MQTILLSSGYTKQTITNLGRHWKILDIPGHAEALEHLKNSSRLPDAVVIGFVPGISLITPQKSDLAELSEIPAQMMLQEVLNLDSDLPVIISAGESHPRAIVELIKKGAFSYVVEPVDKKNPAVMKQYNQELEMALNRAVKWRLTILENRRLKQSLNQRSNDPKLVSCSEAMNRVKELVKKVASTPATVLVSGESGTGKELVAKLIHSESNRADKPFIAINCGAITETLLHSELFGHVKGSFTGADSHNPGLIRQAGKGTLLLDEIGALSPGFQVILLRVLEERIARPVGGQTEYMVRCRFIAAGNNDLNVLVKSGKFRADLFYRLNVFHIDLPPLNRRREDIPLLANHFLTKIAREYNRDISGFEPAAMELLENYPWPGNIRELRNAIERSIVMCDTRRIRPIDFAGYLNTRNTTMTIGTNESYQSALAKFETGLILNTMGKSKGNISLAARMLKMKRTTLMYKLKRIKENQY